MNDLTPAQIQRDEFLRKLAKIPGEGLRHWKKILPVERAIVITYMTISYDAKFAQHFKAEADKRKRPDSSIHITNDPRINAAFLTGKKFARSRQAGNAEIWVHPTGDEVWRIPPAKGDTSTKESEIPKVGPQRPKPLHPDVEEALLHLGDYTEQRNELIRQANGIAARRGSLSKEDYDKLVEQWYKDQDEYSEAVKETIESFSTMSGDLSNEEREKFESAKSQLESMKMNWPNTFGN